METHIDNQNHSRSGRLSGKTRPRCKVLLLVAHADDEIIFAGRGIAEHCFVSVLNF